MPLLLDMFLIQKVLVQIEFNGTEVDSMSLEAQTTFVYCRIVKNISGALVAGRCLPPRISALSSMAD